MGRQTRLFVDTVGVCVFLDFPCLRLHCEFEVTFGETVSLGMQTHQRNHFKKVHISLVLKVIQPWAAEAFEMSWKEILGNTRTHQNWSWDSYIMTHVSS